MASIFLILYIRKGRRRITFDQWFHQLHFSFDYYSYLLVFSWFVLSICRNPTKICIFGKEKAYQFGALKVHVRGASNVQQTTTNTNKAKQNKEMECVGVLVNFTFANRHQQPNMERMLDITLYGALAFCFCFRFFGLFSVFCCYCDAVFGVLVHNMLCIYRTHNKSERK